MTREELRVVVKSLRVLDWWYFAFAPALGCALTGAVCSSFWIYAGSAFSLAFAYAINTLGDIKSDPEGTNPLASLKSLSPLVAGIIYLPGALVVLLALLQLASPWLLISTFSGFVYSSQPFRLKEKPFLSDLANLGIFVPLLFACPHMSVSARDFWWISYMSCQMEVAQVFHCNAHFEDDRRANLRNTAQFLGRKVYMVVGFLLGFISVVLSWFTRFWWLWGALGVCSMGIFLCLHLGILHPDRARTLHRLVALFVLFITFVLALYYV